MQTDLELTRACAEAMGIELTEFDDGLYWDVEGGTVIYHPLHDDAQAMALVKRFGIDLVKAVGNGTWTGSIWNNDTMEFIDVTDVDLNRAICECVARMKGAK